MLQSSTSFEPGLDLSTSDTRARRQLAAPVNSRTRETSDALGEQIAVICHELRNSLAVVRGAARLLRASKANEADSARLLIERHVSQMSRHIEDLLQPQGRGAFNQGLQLSRLDLRVTARYAADAIGPEMTRRRHRLVVQLPDAPVRVHADGARLEQVLSNLLINAAKYTPDGGDITLTLERDDDQARVRIRDSGVGIEPRMLSRVFGMFFQVDTAQPGAQGGRGIGLAVVRDVVEQHGGTVTANSAGLGLGSEFTVALPIRRTQAGSSAATS
jgi:two-component system CheB/CheR fusion protein